jgi:tRNA1(Val) A37 N6-methylase TrmN6
VQPKRFLAEFSKKKQDVEQHILVIESEGRHQYSEEYKRLTADFYLR